MNTRRRKLIEEEIKQLVDENGAVTFYMNPKIDYLFGQILQKPVPTKQDAFKPISAFEINEDKTEVPIKDLYIKKSDNESIILFTTKIREIAEGVFKDDLKITKPNLVEVLITISTLERRFKEVDVDNLAKCVLDALNGVAFDDDSQVSTLLCQKFVHEMKTDSIFIAITKLTSKRRGVLGDLKLFSSNKI